MKAPSKKRLNILYTKGIRPQVVACVVHKRNILFLYNKQHDIWGFAQGGIEPNEDIYDALKREMDEELGKDFTDKCQLPKEGIFGQYTLEFPKNLQGTKEIQTIGGKDVTMIGKKYFYTLVKASSTYIDLAQSEFDQYCWMDYEQAIDLISQIYQRGKRTMTQQVVDILYDHDIID